MKGAAERKIVASVAETIFEQAEKFAGYGFNKGHAAAYAQVAYQTAFLKANYPVEFLAASMTLDIGNTDRLNIFRQEAQRLGVKVAPPDINARNPVFTCDADANTVFYALAAVKGVGRRRWIMWWSSAARAVVHVAVGFRPPGGSAAGQQAGVRESGAGRGVRQLNPNRRQVVENSDRILGGAQAAQRERESGQVSLFGGASGAGEELRLSAMPDWPVHERLGEEFSAMGFICPAIRWMPMARR